MIYWHNKARAEIAAMGICANMLEIIWEKNIGNTQYKYFLIMFLYKKEGSH